MCWTWRDQKGLPWEEFKYGATPKSYVRLGMRSLAPTCRKDCWKDVLTRSVPMCSDAHAGGLVSTNLTEGFNASGALTPFAQTDALADGPCFHPEGSDPRVAELTFDNVDDATLAVLAHDSGFAKECVFEQPDTVLPDQEFEEDVFQLSGHWYNLSNSSGLTNFTGDINTFINTSGLKPTNISRNVSVPWFSPTGYVKEDTCYMKQAQFGTLNGTRFRVKFISGANLNLTSQVGGENHMCRRTRRQCYCDDKCHLPHYNDCCLKCWPAVADRIQGCRKWQDDVRKRFPRCLRPEDMFDTANYTRKLYTLRHFAHDLLKEPVAFDMTKPTLDFKYAYGKVPLYYSSSVLTDKHDVLTVSTDIAINTTDQGALADNPSLSRVPCWRPEGWATNQDGSSGDLATDNVALTNIVFPAGVRARQRSLRVRQLHADSDLA